MVAIGSTGQTCGSASTDAQGSYTLQLNCNTAPIVLTVTSGAPSGIPLDAIYLPSSRGQSLPSSMVINIDPLTTLVAYDAIGNLGLNANSNTEVVALSATLMDRTSYAAALQSVLGTLAPVLANYGLDATSYDPISSAYPPLGTGIDAFFDAYPESAPSSTVLQLGSQGSPLVVAKLPANSGSPTVLSGTTVQTGTGTFPYAGYTVFALQTSATAIAGQANSGAGAVDAASATQGTVNLGQSFTYQGISSPATLNINLSNNISTLATATDAGAAPIFDPRTNGGVFQVCENVAPGVTQGLFIAVANAGSGADISSHFTPLNSAANVYAAIGSKPLFAMFGCAYSAGSGPGTATPSTTTNDYATIDANGNLHYNALGVTSNPVLNVPAADIDQALTSSGAPILSNGTYTYPGTTQTTGTLGQEYWHAWSFVDPFGATRVVIVKQLLYGGAASGYGTLEAYVSQ